MIRSVERDVSSYAELPAKFEAGTPSIAEASDWGTPWTISHKPI